MKKFFWADVKLLAVVIVWGVTGNLRCPRLAQALCDSSLAAAVPPGRRFS